MLANYKLPNFQLIRGKLSVIVTPFRYMVDSPIRLMWRLGSSFVTRQHLLETNAELRAKELVLRARLQTLLASRQEQQNIKSLMESKAVTHWFSDKFSPAHLLAVDLNPFRQQLLIDRGRRDHVYIGQPVIDGYGLVGQVISVGELTSRILVITDTHSAVPVQIRRTGFRAIAIGGGQRGTLELVHILDTVDLKEGDEVVTSGLGLRYPMGYPVGRVSSILHLSGQRFAQVLLAPSAHLHQGRQVLLAWPKKHNKDS